MARIALGITLALLLATCFFGFSTRTKIQGLNDQVGQLGTQLNSAKQTVVKDEALLKTAQDDAAKSKADADAAKATLVTVQGNLDAATKQVTELTGTVAALQKQIATTSTNAAQPQGPQGVPQEQFDKVTAQLKDAQTQVAELKTLTDTLKQKDDDAESRAKDLQTVVDHYKSNIMKNGLEGEVLAVNQGWNFVVLSIGDRQGAVTNAEMILKRGNSQIGKVRITSVEPSTSVADIIPGSLARGVRVQPGDRVIFPGS